MDTLSYLLEQNKGIDTEKYKTEFFSLPRYEMQAGKFD